jgi:hypothetical protein
LSRIGPRLEFVLYHHGPFSFDLRDELTDLRASGVLEVVPQSRPYGPRLRTADRAEQLRRRFPKTLHQYSDQLDFVAQEWARRG